MFSRNEIVCHSALQGAMYSCDIYVSENMTISRWKLGRLSYFLNPLSLDHICVRVCVHAFTMDEEFRRCAGHSCINMDHIPYNHNCFTAKVRPPCHSGEKPNKCNQCYFASSQASYLRINVKTHSKEKLHQYGSHSLQLQLFSNAM